MTKKENKAFWMNEMGKGRQMITGAEFSYAFGDINLEKLNDLRAEGNRLILQAVDGLEAK